MNTSQRTPQSLLLGLLLLGVTVVATSCSGGGGGGGAAPAATSNNPPTVTSGAAVSTDEDTDLTVTIGSFVTDPDGDTLTVDSIVTPPTNGTLSTLAGGQVTYSPNPDFNGSDTFRFKVSDGNGGEVEGDVAITVQPVNDDPTATAAAVSTDEDTALPINLASLVTDVDGDTITIAAIVLAPTQGTLGAITAGSVTYTPTANVSGSDTFRYRAEDGNGGTVEGDVTITIQPVNDSPVVVNDMATTTAGTAVVVNVLANDTDAEMDPLTIASVSVPTQGTATIDPSGTSITYTPNPTHCGADQFSYTVEDGNGGTTPGTVDLTVLCEVFALGGDPIQENYDIDTGNVTFVASLTLEESTTNQGFPNNVTGLTIVLQYDSSVLTAVSAAPGPDLQALNGGGGPDVFMASLANEGEVSVTIETGAEPLSASMILDIVDVAFMADNTALVANPMGVSSLLSWGASSVQLALGPLVALTADIAVDLIPNPVADSGFFFIAPGQTAPYDPILGAGTVAQAIHLLEGTGTPGFPHSVNGFSLGIAHDQNHLIPTTAELGSALTGLNAGAGPDFATVNMLPEGITAAVVVSFQFLESLQADMPQEIVNIVYNTNPANLAGNTTGQTTSLQFIETLGDPDVTNLVVAPEGFFPTPIVGTIQLDPQ